MKALKVIAGYNKTNLNVLIQKVLLLIWLERLFSFFYFLHFLKFFFLHSVCQQCKR